MTQMAFVLSTGRTGTKFLAEYFNATYESVLALHEPDPSHLLRIGSHAYAARHISRPMLLFLYWLERRMILRTLSAKIYLEATGYLYGFVDVLHQIAENPIILHIVRDPREFVRSEHNYGSHHGIKLIATNHAPFWYPPIRRILKERRVTSIGAASAKWVVVNHTLLEAGPRHRNYHLIRFEDLFDGTCSGLRRICDILGVDFVESGPVLPSMKINTGQYRKLEQWQGWSVEQCRELHEICSPLMQKLGYGLEDSWQQKLTQVRRGTHGHFDEFPS